MGTQIIGLRVAAVVFGLVCIAQLVRFLMGTTVMVANHVIPLWPSAVAFIVTGCLCVWLWSLSTRGGKHII